MKLGTVDFQILAAVYSRVEPMLATDLAIELLLIL